MKLWIGLFVMMVLPVQGQVIYLDEALLNKEIAAIMRSRGIEPELGAMRTMVNVLASACNPYQMRNIAVLQNIFLSILPKRDTASMAELYNLAFYYLKIGRLYTAVQIWQQIALSNPTNEEEESYVNAALELSMIPVHNPTYPFIRIPIRKIEDSSEYIMVPPIAASTLVASLIT